MKKIILIIALTLPVVGFSADSQGKFITLGHGANSCGKVVQAYQKDDFLFYGSWVNGYLTAINQFLYSGQDIMKGVDIAGRDLWIYNYCSKNPLNTLRDATTALYRELLTR